MNDAKLIKGRSELGRRDFLKLGAGAAAWMGVTNSRMTSAQGKANRFGVIDCHAHWQPEAYLKAMKELGHPVTNPNPYNFDLARRLKRMDEQGVQMHVLTILTPAVQWAPLADGAHLAQIINDAAIDAHTAFPDRFVAGVAMPIQDPALALKELNRVAGKPGIRAIHLPTSNEAKDYLFQQDFEPIFERAEQLGYPLIFHPIGPVAGEDRLEGPAFLNNSIGYPFEHTITAARFIVNGVLDKYPNLQIVFPHAGGAFPYVAGRIEYALGKRNIKLPRPFREYIRRFHYDTIAYYPETLRFLIGLVGSDRVVIGTDNYALMDVDRPTALVEELNLPAEDRERIFTTNAVQLLHLQA
jgi:aminocarboxymuconate-semialdehyde decarboxylase